MFNLADASDGQVHAAKVAGTMVGCVNELVVLRSGIIIAMHRTARWDGPPSGDCQRVWITDHK
jgi:hypothetical protein